MSVACASSALDTLLLIDDLVVDRDAAFWGKEIASLQLARIDSSMHRAIQLFPFGHKVALSRLVARTGTVLEPHSTRRSGQSPCNIVSTSQVPGECRWLHRGLILARSEGSLPGKN